MPQKIMKRHAIIKALCTGRTAKEIIDFFNYNKDLVYRIKKQFEACDDPETFTGERKTHKRHSDAIKSPEFVTKVKQRIQDDPSKSMANLVFKMNVNKSTISRTVAKDLNMKCYCLKKHHLLTAALMEQRLIKGTALLNKLKHESSDHVRFFSDEKKFIQDKLYNQQNNRFIPDNPEEIPIVTSTKFPTSVMVLGIVSSDAPYFFLKGLRVAANNYVHQGPGNHDQALDGWSGQREAVYLSTRLCASTSGPYDPGLVVPATTLPLATRPLATLQP